MKKTLLSVAGIAVALSLIGGGTFAGWYSEDSIDDHTVQAGHLTLNVHDPRDSSTKTAIDVEEAYPGMDHEWNWYVANQSSVPSDLQSTLSLTLQDLTTNGAAGDALADEMQVRIRTGEPRVVSPGQDPCSSSLNQTAMQWPAGTVGSPGGWAQVSDAMDRVLQLTHPSLIDGDKLEDGSALCVMINLRFSAATATNDSQNGSYTFDSEFRLDQVL
jgi:predicted ribosomally synthesized peptide with SipW-like signal peptide